LEWLSKEAPELLEHIGPCDVNVGAAWPTNRSNLENMASQNVGVGHVGDLIQSVSRAGEDLRLRQIPAPRRHAIDEVLVNPVAYPGVVSSRIGKNRGQVFRASAEIAKQQFDDARGGFTPDLSLWACGGREKPNHHVEPGKELKSRLVLMPETPSTLLESAFSQPFTKMVQAVQGDIAIGMEMTNEGFSRLVNKFKKFSHCKAYDWSAFDSRVREDMLVVAFGVIRACFYDGDPEQLDNLFLRFMSHTIVKQVVTPEGYYYTVTQGVPSGSPFTSLLDSIVNWLVLVDLEGQFCKGKEVRQNKRTVYGDDFVQGWGVPAPHSSVFIGLANRRWGFVVKRSAVKEGPMCTESAETSLPFLSFHYPHGLPARPVSDAVRLALLPRRQRTNVYLQAQRVSYLTHFPPFDMDTAKYHTDYLGWCLDRATYVPSGTKIGCNAVSIMINEAMAGYGGGIYHKHKVFNDEWFRAKSPRKLTDTHVKIAWARSCGRPYPNQPAVTANLSLLRFGMVVQTAPGARPVWRRNV
jgi:hypothetical protein